ncbi:MAG: flagellar hook-basal body protein [Armatimonadetes bacterium]|nr:MAG: flagellar hook-basal body protein [Armatimonadota bacterium]
MTRGIEAAARGMKTQALLLDVVANNLANVNTTGYKRDVLVFSDMLEREVFLPGPYGPELVGSIGTGPTVASEYTVAEAGPLVRTDNPLDVALPDAGQFLAVQTRDGVRYTRDGSLTVLPDGYLGTKVGNPVLDATGRPLFVGRPGDFQTVRIDERGAVLVDDVEVGLLNIVSGKMRKVGANLWEGSGVTAVAEPRVSPGYLEGSNVDGIREMVLLTSLMRQFEANQKAAQTQDELVGQLIRSLAER